MDGYLFKKLKEHAASLATITQDVKAIVVCTQAEYDALTPDAETLYLISG
jgi:hypothetical protein